MVYRNDKTPEGEGDRTQVNKSRVGGRKKMH